MIGVIYDGDYFIIKRFRKGLKLGQSTKAIQDYFIIKRFRKGLRDTRLGGR